MSSTVTWLLPVKNAMPYLTQTLASIAQQTHRDFSVLAWDNGSTDGSAVELCRWIGPRIPGRIVLHRPCGLGASLGHMVHMAESELCARIDADDVNEPQRLAVQVEYMLKNPEVAVVGSDVQWIDGHDEPIPGAAAVPRHDADIRWRLRFCNAFNHPTVMFRRSAVLAAGNYQDLMPLEDLDLWVRVATFAKMANIGQPLLRYRRLNSSVSARHMAEVDAERRQMLGRYTEYLFPGLTTLEATMLRRVLDDPKRQDVDLWHLHLLRQSAGMAAEEVNQRPGYFRSTDLYRQQMRGLQVRWARTVPVLREMLQAARAVSRVLGGRRLREPVTTLAPRPTLAGLGLRHTDRVPEPMPQRRAA